MEDKKKHIHPTRIFKEPSELFDAWLEYKALLLEQAKKWPRVQYVGRDGNRVEDAPVLPYTMEGFGVYCIDNYGHVSQYFGNQDSLYVDFIDICTRIRMEIRDQQITGGMLGNFNPSITQRLNNLKEQVEQTNIEQKLFE